MVLRIDFHRSLQGDPRFFQAIRFQQKLSDAEQADEVSRMLPHPLAPTAGGRNFVGHRRVPFGLGCQLFRQPTCIFGELAVEVLWRSCVAG